MPTAYKMPQVQGTASTGTYATLYSTSTNTAITSHLLTANHAASAVTVRVDELELTALQLLERVSKLEGGGSNG